MHFLVLKGNIKHKGYDPHEIGRCINSSGKYASRNFQYGRYSRIDYMKRHLCVSCSHDYRADRKNTIIRLCTEARSSCILTKVVRKCHKIISPILIRYFWTCHQVQILDWKPGFCKSADFIGQNEKKSKNQHQKINIPSSSVFWFGDSKVLIQRKK